MVTLIARFRWSSAAIIVPISVSSIAPIVPITVTVVLVKIITIVRASASPINSLSTQRTTVSPTSITALAAAAAVSLSSSWCQSNHLTNNHAVGFFVFRFLYIFFSICVDEGREKRISCETLCFAYTKFLCFSFCFGKRIFLQENELVNSFKPWSRSWTTMSSTSTVTSTIRLIWATWICANERKSERERE